MKRNLHSLFVSAAALVWLSLCSATSLQGQSGTDNYILDAYADAYAAYSLRQLDSEYSGPAIRVKRSSDGAETDVEFTDAGFLDIAALERWLGSADGLMTIWYSQIPGVDDLSGTAQIADAGVVYTDAGGLPRIRFYRDNALSSTGHSIQVNNATVFLVQETTGPSGGGNNIVFDLSNNLFRLYSTWTNRFWFLGQNETGSTGDNTRFASSWYEKDTFVLQSGPTGIKIYQNDEVLVDQAGVTLTDARASRITVGSGFEGYMSEVLLYPSLTDEDVFARYDEINPYWQTGPQETNRHALLPQQFQYQIDLYDWLETIDVADVTLPAPTFTWDGSITDIDELADLWLQAEGLTASSVTRGEPEWYVLDAGNGKGIEATGEVRVWHDPKGGDYHGNPPRSWSNEPAFLFQLRIPLGSGSEGNPYYHNPAMGRRALVVAIVDMLKYHEAMLSGASYATWQDMYGKALLGWAETYRWTKHLLDAKTQSAFEMGFGHFIDQMISEGPRAVNTNMDMFSVQAAAEIYMATDDRDLQTKAVQAVKRTLFGYPDGELGSKHDVFKAGAHLNGGVFDPSGFIMEGDQPDIFYGGESIYHVAGALAAVTDREAGTVPMEWAFLKEVTRRLQAWRTYQYFYDPGVAARSIGGTYAATVFHSGAGFAGRTGASIPAGQASHPWKYLFLADRFEDARHLVRSGRAESSRVPSRSEMERQIYDRLKHVQSKLESTYSGEPPVWQGWSPWTKKTPYLPQSGWYSRLKKHIDDNDASTYAPVRQRGRYYSKVFGGPPVGDQYWAYKNTDGGREWGFFLEAQGRQGGYGGWYGGKLETFWTESTGVVLMNRHGKTGCDDKFEDSVCWDNLEYKAGHHVWGRDENGRGFTTLLLRGRQLQRDATFDMASATPSVTINNVFNDTSHDSNPKQSETGERTGSELTGRFEVVNTFEALSDGVRVKHSLSSNQSDEATELWASLPVFLRLFQYQNHPGDKIQEGLDDTTIEYWTGASWSLLPEDKDSDGIPELVQTDALRLGRDFKLGDGPQYVYVSLEGAQQVRLSTQAYEDPYQTMVRVRTVHIDLHGKPGTVRTLPASKMVIYTVQTTDPTNSSGESRNTEQQISLNKGWNLVSRYVQPTNERFTSLTSHCADLEMVKDNSGRVFAPNQEVAHLEYWRIDEAYQMYTNADCSLSLTGVNIKPVSVELEQGWNLLPYPFSEAQSVESVLSPIIDNVLLVEDQYGSTFEPAVGVNTIGNFQPGAGYRVYVSQDVTFTFPSSL